MNTIIDAFNWLTRIMPSVVTVLKALLAIGMTLDTMLKALSGQFSELSIATRTMITA